MRWLGGVGVLLVLVSAAPAADEPGPTAVVERLNAALLGVLKQADSLGYAGRVTRLTPAVSEAYDVPFMAEKSLGQRWATLSPAQREHWVDLSRQFSVANYAANFDRDSGQRIELLGEEPASNDTAIVRTRINDPSGDPIEMTYRLHRTDAGWRIIDVYLKGTVSELALRRADYTSVLERQGFDALCTTMQTRIADLATERGKQSGR